MMNTILTKSRQWLVSETDSEEEVVVFCKGSQVERISCLSNMSTDYPFLLPLTTIDGVTIGPIHVRSSEHVFQAFKSALAGHRHLSDKMLSSSQPQTPLACKRMTNRKSMVMSGDQLARWEMLCIDVMFVAVTAKFRGNEDAAAHLRSTGTSRLVEQLKFFRDKKWGVDGKGVGQNLMGQILMQVRDALI
jgi:ribA/ribD-fused uncharacterized protein